MARMERQVGDTRALITLLQSAQPHEPGRGQGAVTPYLLEWLWGLGNAKLLRKVGWV
jgi:hypothetical protein